ncbi:MAG: DUF488 family protein [Planctomycetota bacterium]
MLKKGCVDDLRLGALNKSSGLIVLPMCHYPRGLSKQLLDEYIKVLGPDKALLDEFHAERERLAGNHNAAFLSMKYQSKFTLSSDGIAALERITKLSSERDVYVVCQCSMDQRCHRELLLIMAKKWWGAKTELRTFSYPGFEQRLGETPGQFV